MLLKLLLITLSVLKYTYTYPSPLNSTVKGEYNRIVGGTPASVGQYPYQVSLRINNRHFCGGSIISQYWIITAAHCVVNVLPANVNVVVGTNYLNTGGIAYGVAQIIRHNLYNVLPNANDIAVIRVSSIILFSNVVHPINLHAGFIPAGSSAVASGWGLTSYPSNDLPNSLQQIQLTTISVLQCQISLPSYPVFNTNLCTYSGIGKGTCQGDSGGPLVVNGLLAGLVSWGVPCAIGLPDVFTNVATYRLWIFLMTGV